MDDNQLTTFLEELAPADFARILARIPNANNHVPQGVSHLERVAVLLHYVHSYGGTEQGRFEEIVKELFPDSGGGNLPTSGLAVSKSPVKTQELPTVELYYLMTEKLNRTEVGILWFDLFETLMDEELPNRAAQECVINLLSRCTQQEKVGNLVAELARTYPHALVPASKSEKAVRRPLEPPLVLAIDAAAACESQVANAFLNTPSAQLFVERETVTYHFEDFLRSDRTLFVLVGESGAGKSFLLREWVARVLKNFRRLLIGGYDLVDASSLAESVASTVRSWVRPEQTANDIWNLLCRVGTDTEGKVFTLLFDDLPLPEDVERFSRCLEAFCEEAQRNHVKIVIATRSSVWRRLYLPESLSPFLYQVYTRPGEQITYSYEMDTLSASEQESILQKHYPDSPHLVASIVRLLGQPLNATLRNPYRLSLLLKSIDSAGVPTAGRLDIDTLLDQEIERSLVAVARTAGLERAEIEEALPELVQLMYAHRDVGATIREIMRLLSEQIPDRFRKLYDRLLVEGILSVGGEKDRRRGRATFSNPQLGDRLTVTLITERIKAEGWDGILSELKPGLDDGIVSTLIRVADSEITSDVRFTSERILESNVDWLAAICEGLIQRRDINPIQLCLLLSAWSNRESPEEAGKFALKALGHLTARFAFARRWVAALYLDDEVHRRLSGEVALGFSLSVSPRWATRLIEMRLRRDLSRPKTLNDEKRFEFINGALRPLEFLDSSEAAALASPIEQRLRA